MAQYKSRLNITVKTHGVWDKLKAINWAEYGLDESVVDRKGTISIVDGLGNGWGISESELKRLVQNIAIAAPGECIVAADTHNENVDPYNYMVYYLRDQMMMGNPWVQTEHVGYGTDNSYKILRYAIKEAYSAEELYEIAEENDLSEFISESDDIDTMLSGLLDEPNFFSMMYDDLNPENNDGKGQMPFETNIADIKDWCTYAGIGYDTEYLSQYVLMDGYADKVRKMQTGELSGDEMIQLLMIDFD